MGNVAAGDGGKNNTKNVEGRRHLWQSEETCFSKQASWKPVTRGFNYSKCRGRQGGLDVKKILHQIITALYIRGGPMDASLSLVHLCLILLPITFFASKFAAIAFQE